MTRQIELVDEVAQPVGVNATSGRDNTAADFDDDAHLKRVLILHKSIQHPRAALGRRHSALNFLVYAGKWEPRMKKLRIDY